ncbi:MAG: DUF2817 domain-containing protein [Pseudomonadota bacterium]
MSAENYFSKTYQDARAKFLAACNGLGLRPTEFRAPNGPQAPEPPLIDCLRLGPPSARHLLVIFGGDRKTDALCCSGIETGWLSEFGKANLPADTAIVLLHHGAAPATGGEVPGGGGPPPQWENDILAKVEERYAEYARQQGIDSTGAPLAEPTDGDVPGYPARVLDMLAHAMAPTAVGRIGFVEIRVGLGPWGEAELFPCHPRTSPETKRIRRRFSLPEPSEDAPPGDQELDSLGAALRRRFASADITAATAAFGTYSMKSVLETLAARPEGQATAETGQMVFPQSAEWRDAVWRSAIVVIQRALTGLHAD